jgi:hypothetical protein
MHNAIERYLAQSARPLEAAFLEAMANPANAEPFLKELASYQNADGGFGNALEPDLRPPESSALATTVAFQYLVAAGIAADNPLVVSGLAYFSDTFQAQKQCWDPIPSSTADHPSAPWWNYEASLTPTNWGNPSAEVLSYLLHYQSTSDVGEALSSRAVERLSEIEEPEFHELLCFGRLYQQAGVALKEQLWPALAKQIVAAVENDPTKWAGYQATPLSFVDSPESPFYSLFNPAIIEADLQRTLSNLVDGHHWEPPWSWEEAHPAAWADAKEEWSAVLTRQNLVILKNFNLL